MKLRYSQIAVLITSTLLGNVCADILKVKVGNPERLVKRSINESYVSNFNEQAGLFRGTIEVGSPPQKITVAFDTGSYTLAINGPDSEYCQENGCTTYGTFDPSLSSSSANTTSKFSAGYADGSTGKGFYFNDTLTIGGLTMDDYKFGVLASSNSDSNVMGLSMIADDDVAPVLYNFLYHSGLTARKVYSSYYSSSQGEGAFVFGGLDEARYTGTLERIPSYDSQSYSPILTGVSNECGEINTNGYQILLDTGAEFSMFPEEVYHQIHQSFGGVTTNASIQNFTDGPLGTIEYNYIFKCSAATSIYLDFSGKKVTYRPENFLITLYDGDSPLTDEDGDQLCITNLFNGLDGSEGYVLGEGFFMSVFVVWDVDNYEVVFADSIDASDEELVEITGDVPNAVKAQDYDSPNSNTADTSYASPVTTSFSLTTILTSGAYTGPFSTGVCTSVSSASSSSASSISSSNSASSTSANTQSSSQAASSTESSQGSSSSLNDVTTISSTSYSVTSTGTCVQCSSINKAVTVETTSFSTTSEATCLECAASSSARSASTESLSVSSETLTIATSTYFEHENSTVIKTITSCSNNVCSKITTTSVFVPSSTESTTESTSEVPETSVPVSTSETTSIKPVESTSSIITSETSSTVSEAQSSSTTPTAEPSTTSFSTTEETSSPSSISTTTTSIAGVPGTTTPVAVSSSLIESISSNSDTTVTVQTYVTVSQETSISSSATASSSSVYYVSSAVISTYEGAASGNEVPFILKLFSFFF